MKLISNKRKVIIFDLDNTLTKGSSWKRFNMAMGITAEEDKELYLQCVNKGRTFKEWAEIVLKMYKERNDLTKDGLKEALRNFEYMDGIEGCIQKVKEFGYDILILSGGPLLFVEIVADKLGVEHYASLHEVNFGEDGKITSINAGEEEIGKLDCAKDFCKKHNIADEDVVVVGDGDNERELFKHYKYSITFEESPIKDIAWKTMDSLKEIPNILRKIKNS